MTERPINLKHLYYFWKVATLGGVVRAGEAIHVSPQTLSGQIKILEDRLGKPLFSRLGRNLTLTEAGRMALEYAEEIFALGAEMAHELQSMTESKSRDFRVGVTNTLNKAMVFRLLKPVLTESVDFRLTCQEATLEDLLSELVMRRLDVIISDTPVPPGSPVRVTSRKLFESGLVFVAHQQVAAKAARPFPKCLEDLPVLLPGKDSLLRGRLDAWFDRQRLKVKATGEFDDAALMTAFGWEGVGAFPLPVALLAEHQARGDIELLGSVDGLTLQYTAITVSRHLVHDAVSLLNRESV
jgi:LysR family transcriptional activator of nhaA